MPESLLKYPTFLLSKVGIEAKRQWWECFTEAESQQPGHYAVLASLVEFGPTSQRDLALRLGIDPSDLVARLDGIEELGWAQRRRDPADRRRHSVTITAAGRAAHRRLERRMRELNEDFTAELSAEEQAVLVDLLGRLFTSHGLGACGVPVEAVPTPSVRPPTRTRASRGLRSVTRGAPTA
jgi:DNA-binding MarR family transcriptional regulator